jgi:hypothetical protein
MDQIDEFAASLLVVRQTARQNQIFNLQVWSIFGNHRGEQFSVVIMRAHTNMQTDRFQVEPCGQRWMQGNSYLICQIMLIITNNHIVIDQTCVNLVNAAKGRIRAATLINKKITTEVNALRERDRRLSLKEVNASVVILQLDRSIVNTEKDSCTTNNCHRVPY